MKNLAESYQKSHSIKNSFSSITVDENLLTRKKRECLSYFIKISKNIKKGSTLFHYGNRPVKALPSDVVRVLSECSQNDLEDLAIRNIILNTIMSLEQTSPYAGHCFLSCLSGEKISAYKTRAEPKDADFLLRSHLGTGICYEIVSGITSMIEGSSDISFVLSKTNPSFVLRQKDLFSISGSVPIVFPLDKTTIDKCKILFIEGKIERISEIDRLLQTSIENNHKILLIARDFSPNVINTLYQNFKTNKLNVIPFLANDKVSLIDELRKNNITAINSTAGDILSTISTDDIGDDYDLKIKKEGVMIPGINGKDKQFIVEIPKHFHKLSGLIEDRVLSGVKFYKDIAKFGVVLDSNNNPIFGRKQYKVAKSHLSKFKFMFNNLGCLIVVE